MEEKKIAFICDLKEECNTSKDCCLNGGPCRMTCDIEHAVNFITTQGGWHMEIARFVPVEILNDAKIGEEENHGEGEN